MRFPANLADIVVANISPAWIADLAPEWVRVLKPDGIAILSGFEAATYRGCQRRLKAAGARVSGEFGENEWRMLEITR